MAEAVDRDGWSKGDIRRSGSEAPPLPVTAMTADYLAAIDEVADVAV